MKAWVAAALMAAVSTPAMARVDYAIDLTAPDHHTGQVSIQFPSAGATLDVKMPAWRTGRYTIMNLANGVSDFAASDASGRALKWEKIDKSTWRIHTDGSGPVRVKYEIYGNELGARSRHIDDSHAYLDASAIFMYADATRGDDVSVSLKLPPAWKAYSGMESSAPARFIAPNWDVLVDSPIEAGVSQFRSFNADGKRYDLVVWGQGNYNIDKMAADLKTMVPKSQTIWTGYPFNRYLFIVHATDNVGGATEHKNSTVIQFPRYRFGGDSYMSFLSTAAHEFIHTWNVKAYRNAAMVPYDYQRENYTDLLWMEEGSTEYFTAPLLVRTGLLPTAKYFDVLADTIDSNKNRPGRLVQSVAGASFDEWISNVDRNRSSNAWVNIYSEGAIASWALDIALLRDTGGKVNYRDVHEELWKLYGNGAKGFTSADVRAVLQRLTGHSWDTWWAQNIDMPADQDFAALLAPVGLKLDMGSGPVLAQAGWQADEIGGAMVLGGVSKGGAAWNAGLETGDILVAIDGGRVGPSRFRDMLRERKAGDTMAVSFFRRDQLMSRKLTLGGRPSGDVAVTLADKATPAQKALFERWLGVPYPSR